MASLVVKNVSVKYRVTVPSSEGHFNVFGGRRSKEIIALRDVSFELREGQRLGVIGHNGSGKSTLLKLLSGLIPPYSGDFHSKGEILSLLNRTSGLVPRASLLENARLKGLSLGLSGQGLDEFIFEVFSTSNLEEKKHHPLSSLSTGMSGKFNLSLNALVFKPITILDEWVSTLDAHQSSIGGDLDRMSQTVSVLVMASHNEHLIRKMCNAILLLDQGRVQYFGDDFDHAFSLLNPNKAVLKPSNKPSSKFLVSDNKLVKLEVEEKQRIHVLRYGKAGWHLLKRVLSGIDKTRFEIIVHDFYSPLSKVPKGEMFVFIYRHPIERFLRAFEARKAQGRPFYNSPWSASEEVLFDRYPTLDRFIECLASPEEDKRLQAFHGLLGLPHIGTSLIDILGSFDEFLDRKDDIFYIGSADNMETTLQGLAKRLGTDFQFDNELERNYFSSSFRNVLDQGVVTRLELLFKGELDYLEQLASFVDNYSADARREAINFLT